MMTDQQAFETGLLVGHLLRHCTKPFEVVVDEDGNYTGELVFNVFTDLRTTKRVVVVVKTDE